VAVRIGDEVGSPLLDEWLGTLRSAKWTFFYMPDRENPAAVAAIYRWRDAVDVFGLFRDRSGLAYRSPMPADGQPFRPALVSWTFGGDPVWAIRGVLALPVPGDPTEPVWMQDAPPLCRVLGDLADRGYVVRPPA
jgi:hypothetical protein